MTVHMSSCTPRSLHDRLRERVFGWLTSVHAKKMYGVLVFRLQGVQQFGLYNESCPCPRLVSTPTHSPLEVIKCFATVPSASFSFLLPSLAFSHCLTPLTSFRLCFYFVPSLTRSLKTTHQDNFRIA